jgi:hypothetical protein
VGIRRDSTRHISAWSNPANVAIRQTPHRGSQATDWSFGGRPGTAQRRGKRWARPKGTLRRHGAVAGSLSRFSRDNVPRSEKTRRLPRALMAEDREGSKGDRQLDQGRADG